MGKTTKTSSIQLARISQQLSGKGNNALTITDVQQTEIQTEDQQNTPAGADKHTDSHKTILDQLVTDFDEDIKESLRNIPKGKAKSNRGWKTVRTERYSIMWECS